MGKGALATCPPSIRIIRLKWWARFRFAHPTKFTCRANHQKPVQPFVQKYSAFVLTQISGITPPVSRRMRGVGHRHERAVRCDGHERRDRRTRLKRTAKSCGPDAAVLASSCSGLI